MTLEWAPQQEDAGNTDPGSGSNMRGQPGLSACLMAAGMALRAQLRAMRSGAPPADAPRPRAQIQSRQCGDGPAEGGGRGPPWPALQACSLQASGPLLPTAAALRTPSPCPKAGAQRPPGRQGLLCGLKWGRYRPGSAFPPEVLSCSG